MFDKITSGLARRAVRKAIGKVEGMTVGDVMTRSFISTRPDDTVIHAATKMIAEDISCLIVTEQDELKGIITERDYLQKVPLNKKVFDMKVEDIMTPDVVTVKPDLSLVKAVELMKKNNFRRVVVELDDGYGLVTQTDYSLVLQEHFPKFPIAKELEMKAIMTKKVLTATSKQSFSVARKKMQKRNVGSILIMDKGAPEGIFTEYDVVMQFYDQEGKLSIKDLSAYMRKYVRAAGQSMSIFDANKLLLDKRMRRLPVVDGDKVVGIVTQTDVVRFLFTSMKKLKSVNEQADEYGKLKKEYRGEFIGDHLKVY